MKLKAQLINHLRMSDCWECGADLERAEWRKDSGGKYKASNVDRTLRDLREEERLENKIENRTVFYRYLPNDYERFHQQI